MFRTASSRTPDTHPRTVRAAAITGLVAAGVISVAACSTGYSHGSTGRSSSTAAAAPVAAVAPTGGDPTLEVGSTALGRLVVDSAGHTLYRFDKDTPGSGTSACTGACATAWPPDLVSGQPTVASGVAGTIGVITRADGTRQVTLDGHPLYRFAGDGAPGDTNGDGFGGIWHAVHATPAGAASTSWGAPSQA
jgi:predicted lipoprotein with Yx(FWY)xxD motif